MQDIHALWNGSCINCGKICDYCYYGEFMDIQCFSATKTCNVCNKIFDTEHQMGVDGHPNYYCWMTTFDRKPICENCKRNYKRKGLCKACGIIFDSRTKLFKHLKENPSHEQ